MEFTSLLVYFILLIFLNNDGQEVDGCGHLAPEPSDIKSVYIESSGGGIHKRQTGDTHHNIRIHLTYDESVHQLPKDKQSLIKDSVMYKAIQYWEGALKTRRLSKPIRLARSCNNTHVFRSGSTDISDRQTYCVDGCSSQTMCGDSIVPEQHLQGCRTYDTWSEKFLEEHTLSTGVEDADFLLYVATSNTSRCDSSIAYATYCQLEVEYDRPIAGFINICPGGLSTHETRLELAVATVKHEILHALGFSLSLYGFYRDADGIPLTPREPVDNRPPLGDDKNYRFSDKVVRTIRRSDWLTSTGPREWAVNMMVTPKVTEEVRRHFNCPTLEGAELENQGPAGTRLTHWEKRVFENEIMTGIYTQNPVVSRITLALMEDTGWYMADYSYAEPLEWGNKLGCDFAKKSCFDWIKTKQSKNEAVHPFCTELKASPLRTQCTTRRTAMSVCNMHQYTEDLPAAYRFSTDSPGLGGIVNLADYCPYLQEFNWRKGEQFVRGSECTLSVNTPHVDTNFAIEYYGNDSRCFDQTHPFQMARCSDTFTSNNYGSGCYQYKCIAGKGLHIYVDGIGHRCYREGQLLDIKVTTETSYHQGSLICPKCMDLCDEIPGSCPADSEPPRSRKSKVSSRIPCSSGSSPVATVMLLAYCIVYSSYLAVSTS